MATLKDIAAYTGVSPTTVSNVIHGRAGRVSPETVSRIEDAIRELGYVPNMSARALVSRSSRVIAFVNHVAVRRDSDLQEDPFSAAMIGIIESVLRAEGYYLMVRTVESAEELLSFLRNWNVDGLFLTGVFRDEFFESLTSLSMPMVFIDSYARLPGVCNVGLDDFGGSYLATQHLIEAGHRRIAFTSARVRDGGVLQERFLGYKSALQKNGIPFDKKLVFEYEFDLESCRACASALSKVEGLTAVVSSADIMAIGIMTGLRELGLRIPEDISIVGFDDLSFSQMVTPPLTTIHQDMQQKGRDAVGFMMQLLSGERVTSPEIPLPCRLIERGSVKRFI